jgi:hypothetical protein
LADKFNKLKLASPDEFTIFNFLLDEYGDYGIQDKASVTCRHCGVCQSVRFHFELYSIFPNLHSTGDIRSRILSDSVSNESPECESGGLFETPISEEAIRRGSKNSHPKKQPEETNSRPIEEKKVMTFDEFNSKN